MKKRVIGGIVVIVALFGIASYGVVSADWLVAEPETGVLYVEDIRPADTDWILEPIQVNGWHMEEFDVFHGYPDVGRSISITLDGPAKVLIEGRHKTLGKISEIKFYEEAGTYETDITLNKVDKIEVSNGGGWVEASFGLGEKLAYYNPVGPVVDNADFIAEVQGDFPNNWQDILVAVNGIQERFMAANMEKLNDDTAVKQLVEIDINQIELDTFNMSFRVTDPNFEMNGRNDFVAYYELLR